MTIEQPSAQSDATVDDSVADVFLLMVRSCIARGDEARFILVNPRKAIEHYTDAVQLLEHMQEPHLYAYCLLARGMAHSSLGQTAR